MLNHHTNRHRHHNTPYNCLHKKYDTAHLNITVSQYPISSTYPEDSKSPTSTNINKTYPASFSVFHSFQSYHHIQKKSIHPRRFQNIHPYPSRKTTFAAIEQTTHPSTTPLLQPKPKIPKTRKKKNASKSPKSKTHPIYPILPPFTTPPSHPAPSQHHHPTYYYLI